MAFLAVALPYIQMAGAAVAAQQTIAQGNLQEKVGKMQAKQLGQQALADQAEAQVVAGQERKKSKMLSSRIQALTGASGTGFDSPDIVRNLADVDARGTYNSLAALYSGDTSASSKRLAANMALAEGKNRKKQSRYNAYETILTSGQSFYDSYG